MYSTHNEGKSAVAGRSIRILKSKIYKYMTLVSKNVYIDKLEDIVHKCNNTYHNTIRIKTVDVKSNTYIDIDSSKESDPKFKIAYIVTLSKYRTTFGKVCTPN